MGVLADDNRPTDRNGKSNRETRKKTKEIEETEMKETEHRLMRRKTWKMFQRQNPQTGFSYWQAIAFILEGLIEESEETGEPVNLDCYLTMTDSDRAEMEESFMSELWEAEN